MATIANTRRPRIELMFGGARSAVTNPRRPAPTPVAQGTRGAQQRTLSERGGNPMVRAALANAPGVKRRRRTGAASEILGL